MSVIINKKACFCISVVILNFLTGCEVMNSDYDCPLSASASCMPLHQMDAAVSQGVYPKENKDSVENKTDKEDKQNKKSEKNGLNEENEESEENNALGVTRGRNNNTDINSTDINSSDITNREITNRGINTDADNNSVATKSGKHSAIGSYPKRTKDIVAKIWLAPFIDSKGDYYEQSVVYAVVKNSAWVNLPINSVTVKQ